MFLNLLSAPLFKGLSNSEINQIFKTTHYQIHSYEMGNIISYAGDDCDNLSILLEGTVRGEMTNHVGGNVVISEIFAPNTFTEAFLFADKNKLLINIVAATKVKIIVINKSEFLNLLNLSPKILNNYLNIISNRFVIVSEKLRLLMNKKVKGRLITYLLELEKNNKEKTCFKLGKTHEELADFLGITRPALTRNLLKLKEAGLLEIKNKEIKIIDRKKLKNLLE